MSNTPIKDNNTNDATSGPNEGAAAESQTAEPSTSAAATGKTKQTSKRDALNSKTGSTQPEQQSPPRCLQLEHATPECVPLHVRQLLDHYAQSSKFTQAEKLWLLVYVVALECGFVTQKAYEKLGSTLASVPVTCCFHVQNVRRLTQQPAAYTYDFNQCLYRMELRSIFMNNAKTREKTEDAHLIKSRLMGIVSGDLLVVTLSPEPPTTERGYSVCLSIGRYILNMQVKNKPIFNSFRKLDELSLQLREKVFQPMRAQQLAQLNVQVYPTLVGLPAELYDDIFCYLNQNQLNIVANVNRHLNYYSLQSKHRIRIKGEDDDKDSDKDRARERGLI